MLALFTVAASAQSQVSSSQTQQTTTKKHRPSREEEKTPAVSNVPASSPQAAANPPAMTLRPSEWKIETDNSDLGDILKTIAVQSGMAIDGAVKSVRVFGVYGPGKPTDVLTDLLSGAGYNIIMIGNLSDGAPRELLLSARNGGPPVAKPQSSPASANDSDNGEEEQPGPGAITDVPPAGPEDPEVRRQQQIQRLQQQREQMERQQQQSQPQ